MNLYPFQEHAVTALSSALETGEHPLLVMATGTGKTIVMAKLMSRLQGQILFLAHRDELLNQAQSRIESVLGVPPSREQSFIHADKTAPVIVGSVQTLQKSRLKTWSNRTFDYVFIDEAHHAHAKSYRNIIAHFPSAKYIGATATPDRADAHGLPKFTTVAYQYPLDRAIRDSVLSPIIGRRVTNLTMDLTRLRVVSGDYVADELGDLLTDYMLPLAKAIYEHTYGMKTLIFMPNVKSAHLMADCLKTMTIKAVALSGETDIHQRRHSLAEFKAGLFTHLVGCDLFLEGYDEPSIEVVAMLRPTTSRALYAQAVGRGTRLFPGKTRLLLLEFTWNSQRLRLVEPFELFSAPGFTERVRQRAAKAVEGQTDIDLLKEMDDAHTIEYSIENIIQRTVLPSFSTCDFDPLGFAQLLGVDFSEELKMFYNGRQLRGKITPKQYAFLSKYQVRGLSDLSKAQAAALINQIIKNRSFGSPKPISQAQQFALRKAGVPCHGMTSAQASILIGGLYGRR